MERLKVANVEAQTDKKTFIRINGLHGEQDMHQLLTFRDAITGMVQVYPGARIAVFVEDFFMGPKRSQQITGLVDAGWKPTEAFFASRVGHILDEKEPSRESVQAWLQNPNNVIEDPFLREQYRILDEITENHRGSISLYPETSQMTDMVLTRDYDITQIDQEITKVANKTTQNEFAYRELHYLVYDFHNEMKVREQSLKQHTSEVLASPDIVGAVMFSGIGHTLAFMEADDTDNLNVINIIPDSKDGEYILNPLEAMLVGKKDYDGDIGGFMTDEESRMLLTRTVIWKFVSQAAKKRGKLTEQQARVYVWDKTRHFKAAHVDIFEGAIKDPMRTVQSAIKDVISWQQAA